MYKTRSFSYIIVGQSIRTGVVVFSLYPTYSYVRDIATLLGTSLGNAFRIWLV